MLPVYCLGCCQGSFLSLTHGAAPSEGEGETCEPQEVVQIAGQLSAGTEDNDMGLDLVGCQNIVGKAPHRNAFGCSADSPPSFSLPGRTLSSKVGKKRPLRTECLVVWVRQSFPGQGQKFWVRPMEAKGIVTTAS